MYFQLAMYESGMKNLKLEGIEFSILHSGLFKRPLSTGVIINLYTLLHVHTCTGRIESYSVPIIKCS